MSFKVCFEKNNSYTYPSEEYFFSPSEEYPEYPWNRITLAKTTNHVYDMVRRCFHNLALDKEHYGTPEWNPLGKIIKPDDNVLLKPNMVVSQHPQIDCIVTNPSIVRAVLDYVCIALKGTGSITIGDAPMQRCDFDDLVSKLHYQKIKEFMEKNDIQINFFDFRNFIAVYSTSNVTIKKNSSDKDTFICIDLGKDSLLCPTDIHYKRYRVTNYDYRNMWKYHNKNHHRYLIRKDILKADVIINLPKCKTHKKAGMTAALKNYVGTVVHKECLPHHIRGSKFFGGNEYLYPNPFKAMQTFFYERIDLANIYNKKRLLPLYKKGLNFFNVLISKYHKDNFFEGSWYGNDTIWRTFGDINRILMYSDKAGNMTDTIQRKNLIVGDMIYTGDHEGPVHATPKNVGAIVCGTNPVAFDFLVARLMGFDWHKIPALTGLSNLDKYPLYNSNLDDVVVEPGKRHLDDISSDNPFVPASGWIGHIELEESDE